jgi:mitogen-activated protein kinase kinase kinase
LQQEIELLEKLEHKNIVRYLGSMTEKNFLNVFLEFVGTGTLE